MSTTLPSSPLPSPPSPETWDFFLSHAGPDSAIAATLDEALTNLGRKPWFDKRCLAGGDPWARVLPAILAASRVVVVLVSPATRDAHYQDSEIGRAIDLVRAFPRRYRVVALLLDMQARIPRTELPFGLERTTLLSWSECGSVDEVARRLVAALEAVVPDADVAPAMSYAAETPSDASAAFVGETAWGPLRPVILVSWKEFESVFGPPLAAECSFLAAAVRGFFDNGGKRAYVVRVVGPEATVAIVTVPTADPMQHLIVHALHVGAAGNRLRVKIERGARRGVRFVLSFDKDRCIVEDRDNLSPDEPEPNPLLASINGRSEWIELKWAAPARPAAMPVDGEWLLIGGSDGVVRADDLLGSAADDNAPATGLAALELESEPALLCLPDSVHPHFSKEDATRLRGELVALAERRHLLALIALPRGTPGNACPQAPTESSHACAVAPWVTVHDPTVASAVCAPSAWTAVPAVGHLAGLLARHDAAEGLQKSPAGAELLGLCDGAVDRESAGPWTADDGARRGVNLIVSDDADTAIVFRLGSAVTCAVDETWTRLEVRRTLNYISRRWEDHLAWTTFAPSDEATWAQVRRDAEEFFASLWRAGILLGGRPEEAFFVRCGRDTMTQNDIDAGRLMVLCGLAIAPGFPHPTLTALRALPAGPRRDRLP